MHPSDIADLHLQDHRERVAASLERHGHAVARTEQRPDESPGRPPDHPGATAPTRSPLGVVIR